MAKVASANPEQQPGKAARPAKAPLTRCVSSYETAARARGFSAIAGVDEVGRGCLFGPVFAAAVILDPASPIGGLRDSKELDLEARIRLSALIKKRAVCWALGGADAFEIDQINILQASRLAMRRAVEALRQRPDYLLIDAVKIDLPIDQLSLIDGDARCRAIAAASIIAKVHRDLCLAQWDRVFPQYNLASNKGYSTPDHRRALQEHGPTSLHRFSFEPVRANCTRTFWTAYINGPVAKIEQSAIADATAEPQELSNSELRAGAAT